MKNESTFKYSKKKRLVCQILAGTFWAVAISFIVSIFFMNPEVVNICFVVGNVGLGKTVPFLIFGTIGLACWWHSISTKQD